MSRPKGPGSVFEVRPLTEADLRGGFAPRYGAVQVIRDRHHAMARMLAAGMRPREIATALGCSTQSVQVLSRDPALIELVAEYRVEVDAEQQPQIDESIRTMTRIRLKSLQELDGMLDQSIETGNPLPPRVLLSMAEFASDRTGFAKRTEHVNFDGDMATKLEFAIRRSTKVIEARPNPQPAGGEGQSFRLAHAPPLLRRIH